MNNQRGIIIIGGSVALLVSAVALTLWMRKSKTENDDRNEKMIEKYEEYVHAAPTPKRKPRKTTAARTNGKVVKNA